MSLIVTSLLVASGVLLGRYLARSRKPADTAEDDDEDQRGKSEREEKPERTDAPPEETLSGFVCQLGDVVMRSAGEEAWLAGALVLREQLPVAAIFVAPEAGQDRAVVARPPPAEDLLWLAPVPVDELGLAGKEPPASLEHRSDRFERARRLPVRVERIGSGAPDVGETAIYAEYGSLGGERLIVLSGARLVAYRGITLDAGTFTVLPSGKSSLQG